MALHHAIFCTSRRLDVTLSQTFQRYLFSHLVYFPSITKIYTNNNNNRFLCFYKLLLLEINSKKFEGIESFQPTFAFSGAPYSSSWMIFIQKHYYRIIKALLIELRILVSTKNRLRSIRSSNSEYPFAFRKREISTRNGISALFSDSFLKPAVIDEENLDFTVILFYGMLVNSRRFLSEG